MYATKASGAWVAVNVGTELGGVTWSQMSRTSLVVDGDDNPHVAFSARSGVEGPYSLLYAHRDATGWHHEEIAEADSGSSVSLKMDADGHLHLSYENTGSEAVYALNEGSGWSPETIARMYYDTDLALDSAGFPHIAYGHLFMYRAQIDHLPPNPNPMTWESEPVCTDETSIGMTATEASDPGGVVEYLFDETTGYAGGDDSGWQTARTYSDTDLVDGTEYCYRVKARDSFGQETAWSDTVCVTMLDTTPPACAVHCWPVWPYESAPGEISTDLGVAIDPNGVEYYFEETTGNPGGDDSGWQDSPQYTDVGLQETTQYCYRAIIRDKTTNQNESVWFGPRCETTSEWSVPDPDPMTFEVYPQAVGERSIRMVATEAIDPSGVEYFFTETSGNPRGTWSVWQESRQLVDWGLQPSTTYCYQVRARDGSPYQNETANSVELCVKTKRTPDPTGAPGMNWTRFSNYEDPAYDVWWMKLVDIAVDPDGNVYAVGDFEWQTEDPGWVGQAMVTKWAPDGTRLWHEIFELPDIYCHPRAACTDADGNLYIVGIWAPPESTAWPGWFLTKMSPDGRDVSTYSSDSSWIVLYSVDVDAEGHAYVCGSFWLDGWFTGRFDFTSGSFVWTRGYTANPDTDNIEAVCGVLGPDGYYAAKNYTSSGIDATLMARHRLSDGIVESSAVYDLAAGAAEQVTALDVDEYGQIVGSVWALDSNSGQIVKFDPLLNLEWNMTVTTDATPYMSLRDIVVGPDWKIHAVGRESDVAGWWETDEDSHAFAFCLTGDGTYLWDHTYDPGGAGEGEWGSAEGVGCAPDGNQTYMGATLLYSGTGWQWSLGVLAYGDAPVLVQDEPTAATFLVKTVTGDVRADGSVFATDFRTGAADVAEWVCVSGSVAPGDVLEHDPDRPGCHRLSSGPVSSLIAGVVSTEPGVILGEGSIEGARALLALTGIVPVKVTNEGGPIQAGDLLVASSTPGYAMRWPEDDGCLCTLVGKALEPMTGDSGVVLVLLTAH